MTINLAKVCLVILGCGAMGFAATAAPQARPKSLQEKPAHLIRVAEDAGASSLCLDSMETVPDDDDLDPTPVAQVIDATCQAPSEPVSI